MAKVDKAIPEEIPIEEAPAVIQEIVAAQAISEESFEQRQERLTREEYQRRNEVSLAERKAILERNGLRFEDYTPAEGVEIVRRCCS